MTEAWVKFAVLDDNKEDSTSVHAELSGPGWRLPFNAAGDTRSEDIGADRSWPDYSTPGPFRANASISSRPPTRTQLAQGEISMVLDDVGPKVDAFRDQDTVAFAWRMYIKFSDGRADFLSSLDRVAAPRSAALRLRATSPIEDGNRRVGNDNPESVGLWRYCDALRDSDPPPTPTPYRPATWDDTWFDWRGGPTPRAQFFADADQRGDKLDLDITGTGSASKDLSQESACGDLLACAETWGNRINSLSTTGGGQQSVWLVAWDTVNRDGSPLEETCLLVPPNATVRSLTAVFAYEPRSLSLSAQDWSRRIDRVEVHASRPAIDRCSTFFGLEVTPW